MEKINFDKIIKNLVLVDEAPITVDGAFKWVDRKKTVSLREGIIYLSNKIYDAELNLITRVITLNIYSPMIYSNSDRYILQHLCFSKEIYEVKEKTMYHYDPPGRYDRMSDFDDYVEYDVELPPGIYIKCINRSDIVNYSKSFTNMCLLRPIQGNKRASHDC